MISDSRRKIISKLFINFSGIIFGLLVIGQMVSGKGINLLVFIVGILLLAVTSAIAVFSEPKKSLEEDADGL
ncbi:hypothetical protein HZC34_05840 [Candidatus Saganbacteria bacterium]|nr:hypothetical protein [Candidatus Saganbacteria bacterium]